MPSNHPQKTHHPFPTCLEASPLTSKLHKLWEENAALSVPVPKNCASVANASLFGIAT